MNKEAKVYDIIEKKATSNITMQGITGLLGFPYTLIGDAAVFATHYAPMLNEIRAIYGLPKADSGALKTIIAGSKSEMLIDLVVDKFIGNIPLFGLPANIVCAKAMTWRLGILFGMLSARGDEITPDNVQNAVYLIRKLFPQSSSLMFKKPSAEVVYKLLDKVEGMETDDFDEKMKNALAALD